MDDRLTGFTTRLATRNRSTPDNLSHQSMEAAWAQFQSDWASAICFENFLLDLTTQINERCPNLEFIDTYAKYGAIVSDCQGRSVALSMVNWNGYWDSPIIEGPNIQYPTLPLSERCMTSRDFLDALPKHLNTIADKFVSAITSRGWTAFAKLEIPEGCASSARWTAPLRMIRHYVIDRDVFIARFDMLGGTASHG
jgi:hypothetical protein